MIILDTNVISAIAGGRDTAHIAAWVDRQKYAELYTTAITVFESWSGVTRLPADARRDALDGRLWTLFGSVFQGRVLPFDEAAAVHAAHLDGERRVRGINVDARDTFIAGIARAHSAALATRNTRHFADAGIPLVDPWTA